PNTIQVSLAAPYPGTALYKQAIENGWLTEDKGLNLVNREGVQLSPISYPELPSSEIYESVATFYREFYFRPRKIAELTGEMMRTGALRRRGLREGMEFFRFLHARSACGVRRFLIVTADDFGLHPSVNEAVERGARDGVLTAASLMVAAPAAADAVR